MVRKFGSRSEVWEESCSMTRGGLSKDDLMLSKTGRIVSKKKSEAAREAYNKFGFKKRQQEQAKEQEVEVKKPKRRRKKKPKDE